MTASHSAPDAVATGAGRQRLKSEDQKLALLMGLVILILMTVVLAASSSLFSRLQNEYNRRLSIAIAKTISESITRVSFAGKFHTRKLVGELAVGVKELSYISVETIQNRVFAHSETKLNDAELSEREQNENRRCLAEKAPFVTEKLVADRTVNEVIIPYSGGIDDEVMGTVRIGIDFTDLRRVQADNFSKLLFLIAGLTVLAILIAYRFSRHFGRTMRTLAVQLQAILDHAPMGLVISRSDGSIVLLSRETESFFPGADSAAKVDELHGSLGDKKCRARIDELEQLAFAGESLVEKDMILCDAAGSHKMWQVSKFPIEKNERGENTLICSFFRDATGKFVAEQEREKLREQLLHSQKMDAIGQLAGGVAHDFNNLLSGIMGAAELLKDFEPGSPQHARFVDIILGSAAKAADLTRKLLTFAHKREAERKPVDMLRVVSESFEIFKRTLDRKIVLCLQNFARQSVVPGDETLLQNLIMNLGINASHAMPDGGTLSLVMKNVSITSENCRVGAFELVPGNYLELELTDTGIGMYPEIQKRIFEPFFTTKEPGRGTGLGLAMVYGSIKAHDGSITVESEPGRGTTFRILLPAAHEAEVTDAADEEVISGSGRVLIVDDEEILRAIGRAMLESMGYDVLLAVNGREAVDLFKKMPEEIDLVILDMIMPVMGGKETLAELKKIRSDCRILVASGFARESELSEMKKLGINGSIRKPFRLAELSRAIAGVMGQGTGQNR